MDETTFAQVTQGCAKQYDVNCRQVSNGFALAGNTRYVNAQGNVVVAQSAEAVATTNADAAEALARFLTTGSFVPAAA